MRCSHCGGCLLKDDGAFSCIQCARKFDENGNEIQPKLGKKRKGGRASRYESTLPLAELLDKDWNEDFTK